MENQQRANVALNLSYVLHERSDSETVRRYVRARETEQRRCQKAIGQLGSFSDAELRSHLIVLDDSGDSGAREPHEIQVISVDIGAGELFPRLLHVAGILKPGNQTFGRLLDGPGLADQRSLSFFGAPAALNTPAPLADSDAHWIFATAVLRPGYSSILLRVTDLEASNWQHAARLAEEVIREFPLQWWCERSLWERPVEETLPEFHATGNGTTSCGR